MQVEKKQIDKVRQDIREYEHHKNMRRLSTLGVLASAGLAGAAGYHGNKRLMAAGASGGFASGFARGRSKREEGAALQRVKNFYDLRKIEKVSGGQEKKAVIGGIAEAISAVPQFLGADLSTISHGVSSLFGGLNVSPEVAILAGAAAPSVIDIATLPWAAHKATESTRDHAYIAAKDAMGLPLNGKEKAKRAWSTFAKAEQMKIDQMKPGLRKKFNEYFKGVYGPLGTGGTLGESAGSALKEVGKFSPRYSSLALGAIKDNEGIKALADTAKKDFNSFAEAGKIIDSSIDDVPGLRKIINSTGKSSSGFAKKLLENPEEAINVAKNFKATIQKSVNASRLGMGALALAGLGHVAGSYRKKHPLAQDTLAKKITDPRDEKRARGSLLGVG